MSLKRDNNLGNCDIHAVTDFEVVRFSGINLQNVSSIFRGRYRRTWLENLAWLGVAAYVDYLLVGIYPYDIYGKLHVLHPEGVYVFFLEYEQHAFVGVQLVPSNKAIFAFLLSHCRLDFKADVFDAFVTQDVSVIDRILKDDAYGGKAAEICFLTTQLKTQYKQFLCQWTKSLSQKSKVISLSQKSKVKESKSSLSECELSPSERFMAFRATCLGRSLVEADVFDAFALQDISAIGRILADNSISKLIWFKKVTQKLVEEYYCFLKKWETRRRENVTEETLNTAQQAKVALAVQKYLKEKESSTLIQ